MLTDQLLITLTARDRPIKKSDGGGLHIVAMPTFIAHCQADPLEPHMTLLTYQGTTRGRTLNDGIRLSPPEEATKPKTGMTSQRIVNPAQRPASTLKGRKYDALILIS